MADEHAEDATGAQPTSEQRLRALAYCTTGTRSTLTVLLVHIPIGGIARTARLGAWLLQLLHGASLLLRRTIWRRLFAITSSETKKSTYSFIALR